MAANSTKDPKQQVYDYIKILLGGNLIGVELTPEDYETCLDIALQKYRQLSSNSVEESWGFMRLHADQNVYDLDPNIISIRQIFRRTIGSSSVDANGTTTFDPFDLAYSNMYLLQSGRIGGLVTYELYTEYTKLLATMFGGYINFTFNSTTHKLTIMRAIRGEEDVLLWMWNYKPDEILINDIYAGMWIKNYAMAMCKTVLGQARSKFGTISGPQGGTSLNGDALKNEALAEMTALEDDIKNYKEGNQPLSVIIG